MSAPLIEKLCPVLWRQSATGPELLVFRHPLAGVQLVKGTREPGEPVHLGALRELAEESGVSDATAVRDLGQSSSVVFGQLWHFVEVQTQLLPDRWSFDTEDGGGHRFDYFWFPMAAEPGDDWHDSVTRALHHIRAALT